MIQIVCTPLQKYGHVRSVLSDVEELLVNLVAFTDLGDVFPSTTYDW
jgi:hypothetical protein